jgi:hypothetical protein
VHFHPHIQEIYLLPATSLPAPRALTAVEPLAKLMGVPWVLRKMMGSFTPGINISAVISAASTELISISRKLPVGTVVDAVEVGRTDNIWTTPEGKHRAAAFAVPAASFEGTAGLALAIAHKVGNIVVVYTRLADGCLSVVTTVFKRPESAPSDPPTTLLEGHEVIVRVAQVFAVAKSRS